MAPRDESKPFRVVICGAGIVGLALSRALHLANIDFVVLEKHSKIVSLHGAALTLFPGVARIFDQFGILEKLQKTLTPITKEYQRWPDGSLNITGRAVRDCGDIFDQPVILFDRERCVSALYNDHPAQSKIRTNAKVERIEQTQDGVKVILADGTVEEGDIVVGADGVHSMVRDVMWAYADEHEPNAIPQSDKKCMSSEYKAAFGVSEAKDWPNDLGPSDIHITFGHDVTKLLFTQPGIAYWGLMYKDEYSQPPKPFKPTPQEQDEIVSKLRDHKFTEAVSFGDLWDHKSRAAILSIEEGVLSQWHVGRMVLVGDSAHKMSADLGIGANMGIESAVVFANILHRETKDNLNRHFTNSELSKLFAEYQSKRHERVSRFTQLSGEALRSRSFKTFWRKIFVSRIATIPAFQKLQSEKMREAMAKAPMLDYVPTRTINKDAEGWKLGQEKKKTSSAWSSYALVTSLVAVAVSYVTISQWGLLMQTR